MSTFILHLVLGAVLILWGLANLFYGYRFYRVSLLVIFAGLGASIGLGLTIEAPNLLQIVAAGVLALIFGLLGYYLSKVLIILAGGMILAIVAMVPALIFSLSETIGGILALVGFVVGIGLAYFYRKSAISLVTALWGAGYVLAGVTLIFVGREVEDLRSLGIAVAVIGYLVMLALVGFGTYWQHKRRAEGREPEMAVSLNRLRFWQTALLALVFGLVTAGLLGLVRLQSPFLTLDPPDLNDFEHLSLDGYERLLVLAPHNDDESLGTGGLIMKALEEGLEVRVVVLTNGDGYLFATMEEFRTLFPSHEDYIELGKVRQQESINAVGVLGVPPENVIFLSYPDRGTPSLWYENWSADDPYESNFTKTTKSPYEFTYNPDSVHAGEDLLNDLGNIIIDYQPDLVVYTQGNDVHPDHWGLNVFARLAVEINDYLNTSYNPDTYLYIVHRPDFPYPGKYLPEASMLPPKPIHEIHPDWYRLDLNSTEVETKEQALREYKSQLSLLWGLMASFVRRNEVFTTQESVILPELAQGEPFNPDHWVDAAGQTIEPIQLDPIADIVERAVRPGTDLKALYLAQTSQDNLVVCAELVSEPEADVVYVLHLKGIGPEGIIDHIEVGEPTHTSDKDFLDRRHFACHDFSMAELGHPVMIFAGSETQDPGFEPFDRMAWQIVKTPLHR